VIIKKDRMALSFGPAWLCLLPGLSAPQSRGPDRRWGFFRRGNHGLPRDVPKETIDDNIRRAMVYGSVLASFCCEGFGLMRTTRVKRPEIMEARQRAGEATRF